jgi:hypothetical protein
VKATGSAQPNPVHTLIWLWPGPPLGRTALPGGMPFSK